MQFISELDEIVLLLPELDEDVLLLPVLDEETLLFALDEDTSRAPELDEVLLVDEELLESTMSVPEGSLGVVMSVDSESPQAAKKAKDRTIDAV
ncbi:hypothetical protein [Fibrobacter sp. UWT3]|uniref:hypothetical protein n=1 Tax=Fibrobacter sp. UWT3 TaxID=1896225 RepID=UPI001144034C|nr:hypothetical protein [Fibrobacter sp. UWT3]